METKSPPMPAASTATVTAPPEDPQHDLETAFPALILRKLPGFLVPEPYRSLLVHDQDMTSTLERFHGEALFLELLSSDSGPRLLRRNVLLVGEASGRPRELGSITIHLHRFSLPPTEEILAGRKPLGAILGDHHIPYTSRPEDFLELESTPEMLAALRRPGEGEVLYGRRNRLSTPEGDLLADVLEILPPLD